GGLSPEALAREVCALESMHDWFPDTLDERVEHEVRVTDADIHALAEARMILRDKLEYLNVALPALTEIPPSVRISAVHEDLREQDELADLIDHSEFPRLP